ncbi:MAG: hypothetical protein RLO81_01465 [Fulvivirga sp.]|uniref:hypothetical protein n=1 Tax=Fulvivirga sp. TaxID=1931237 RepID=UPI0032EAB54F
MVRKLFIVFGLVLFSFSVNAQPGDPGGDPDNPVPITGIEILLLAGGALGLKRIVKKGK